MVVGLKTIFLCLLMLFKKHLNNLLYTIVLCYTVCIARVVCYLYVSNSWDGMVSHFTP